MQRSSLVLPIIAAAMGIAQAQTMGGIANIKEFLKTCPDRDPAIAQIRADFELRNQGNLVTAIRCTEPYNQMPPEQMTTELAIVQTLRVLYYMDQGRSGYLPWTSLRLYDWVKSKISGINLFPNANFSCCTTLNGKTFIIGGILDQSSLSLYRDFRGIAAGIAVLAHEARHRDGFPHTSCCPDGANACDQTYDERNLSPYGVQSWPYRNWLSGNINVGLFCSYSNEIYLASFELSATAISYQNRFCDVKPPAMTKVKQISEIPGGPCSLRTLTLPDNAVVNAAGYSTASLIPGEITCIFGPKIGPARDYLSLPITAQGTVDSTLGAPACSSTARRVR